MARASVEHVSDTALWVAAFRALETERPDALYHDPLAAKLAGDRGRAIAKSMPYAAITAWIMVVRTVAIDRLIFDAINEGVDTIINLGAGLDTRPYRLDLPHALRWIEVDFPHVVEMKAAQLREELPRCELTRLSLDLSQRDVAQEMYGELGRASSKALVITEGVVPYLTNDQAGMLAADLRAIPSFRYWIQDYSLGGKRGWARPKKLRNKLAKAPFQFKHPDPLAFFAGHGWTAKHDILAIDEGERVGRRFPVPFPGSVLVRVLPKKMWEQFRKGAGYVLLEAGAFR